MQTESFALVVCHVPTWWVAAWARDAVVTVKQNPQTIVVMSKTHLSCGAPKSYSKPCVHHCKFPKCPSLSLNPLSSPHAISTRPQSNVQ